MAKSKDKIQHTSGKVKLLTLSHVGLLLALVVMISLTACLVRTSCSGPNNSAVVMNPNWAQPLELPGVPNLHKVSNNLYRGAQPNAEGMEQLKKLGIKTVVNLRSLHSDRDELNDTELAYEHIRMTTLTPEDKDVVRFLKIVTDANTAPVFVHCQYGSDRTGTMCAIYRIAVEGWSKDEAIEEMTTGGFGFHTIWKSLVTYIRKLDIDKIKNQAGLND